MMKCPECGNGKLYGVDSVTTPENEVYRRRKCGACGHTFVTVEFEVEYDNSVQKVWRKHYQEKNRSKST
ncbi:MAG: hypothetical protein NC215_00340 [Ruminococcus sp.]|nr:hypothetical protein [Ruminococcus sp.]